MRVLLVKPPFEGFYASTVGDRHVPIGLMYLAHALNREPGLTVGVFDSMSWHEDTHLVPRAELGPTAADKLERSTLFRNIVHYGATWDRLSRFVRDFEPDVVGITCLFSPYYRQAYRAAEMARELAPRAAILMGGPHATVMWRDVFERSAVDGVLLGEGEQTLPRLLGDLARGSVDDLAGLDVESYPGLAVRRASGEIAVNRCQDFVTDLDRLGFPTRDDFDVGRYHGITSIITSRGCPFSCTFCSVHAIVGKSFRSRSAESVVEELSYHARHGVRTFNIEDDNFTFDMDRVDRIMEAICRAGLDIELRFPNGITAIKLTRERIRLFARAGVKQLFFGLESTDPVMRKVLKKSFAKMDHIVDLVGEAQRQGIHAFVSLITGLPGHTPETMAQEIADSFRMGLGGSTNPFYPITGTELFRRAQADGLLETEDPEWYEPLNFPVAGDAFTRDDVTEAFLLGIALIQQGFRTHHPSFLLRAQPAGDEEIAAVWKRIGVLQNDSLDVALVRPLRCTCGSSGLAGRHHQDGERIPVEQACIMSGRLYQIILELWTRTAYDCEEVACAVTHPLPTCTFRLTRVDRPIGRVVRHLIEHLGRSTNDELAGLLESAERSHRSFNSIGY